MPGALSPALADLAVQFDAALPFAQAAHLLTQATGTPVSEPMVRRLTERAGTAWCQLEFAPVEQLEAAARDPAAALVVVPDPVPLVGGAWAEVRTAAIGQVIPAGDAVRTTELSDVSRLTNAETFTRRGWAEFTRRGVLAAPALAAINKDHPWKRPRLARIVGSHYQKLTHTLWPAARHALACRQTTRYSGAMNEFVRALTTGKIKRSAISIMGIAIPTTSPAGVRMGD